MTSPQSPAIKFFALGVLVLIGIGIYTFPQMSASRWPSPLSTPDFGKISQNTSRKAVPEFQWAQNGKSFKTEDLKGKWHLMSFWAYWCLPCQTELPELADLQLNWNGPDLDVITVNLDERSTENFELAKKFIAENQITLPVYFDTDIGGVSELKKKFSVNELPRHLLINREGEVVWDSVGAFKWSSPSVRAGLLKILDSAPSPDGEGSEE